MNFTNILLITLIGLVGWIGKAFYEKLNDMGRDMRKLIETDIIRMEHVNQLRKDVDGHETRISKIEDRI